MNAPDRGTRRSEARRLLEGLNARWVAERMGVGDATVSAWRRGDRVPELGDLLALAIAVGRPLDRELDAQIVALLEAGRVSVTPTPAVIEAAREEARQDVERASRATGRRRPRPGSRGARGEAGAEGHPETA